MTAGATAASPKGRRSPRRAVEHGRMVLRWGGRPVQSESGRSGLFTASNRTALATAVSSNRGRPRSSISVRPGRPRGKRRRGGGGVIVVGRAAGSRVDELPAPGGGRSGMQRKRGESFVAVRPICSNAAAARVAVIAGRFIRRRPDEASRRPQRIATPSCRQPVRRRRCGADVSRSSAAEGEYQSRFRGTALKLVAADRR